MSKWEILNELNIAVSAPRTMHLTIPKLLARLQAECEAEDAYWCAEEEMRQAVGF